MSDAARNVRSHVEREFTAADSNEGRGDFSTAFRHLERAHVLGQASTREHVRAHWRMLLWAVRQRDVSEIAGQIFRIVGAASMTAIGLGPQGNTGGSNVSPFRRMPIPQDLAMVFATLKPPAPRKRLIGLCAPLVLVAIALAPFAMRERPRTIVSDGHRVAFRVVGHGRPAMVMISGLGDGMATFDEIADDLGKTGTVIIYDRAGYGGSETGMGPRDAEAAARELSGLLAQSGVGGPFVLAGHSLGGLFAEYYAAKHPEQVAGLILEESRPADFTRKCLAVPDAGMCEPPAWLVWLMPKGARGEAVALAETMAEVEAAEPLKDKPVLVLSRPSPNVGNPFEALWTEAQAGLAARYAGSQHLTAKAGGHYPHRDERDWFLDSVRRFLTRVH